MKMEIKKYNQIQKTKIEHLNDFYTDPEIAINLDDCNIPNDLNVVDFKKNEISFCNEQANEFYTLRLDPQDIRNLMKWQLGQDEYNENKRKHKDKQLIKEAMLEGEMTICGQHQYIWSDGKWIVNNFHPITGGTMSQPLEQVPLSKVSLKRG